MLHVIRNARVFAPADRGVLNLMVAGGRVVWMGPDALELPAALGAEVVDVDGRSVVPGLIDGHAHVTGGGGESGFASQVPRLELSRFTAAGVTTVVGVLGTDDVTRSAENLLARVRGLREEGLSAFAYAGGYHLPVRTLTGSLRGDLVAIEPFIGVGELAISDHRSSQPTVNELLRVAADCHVAGLVTGKAGIVHLHLGDGVRGLDLVRRCLDGSELPARVFHPTHVNRRKALFDEALAIANRGCTVDVTAFPVGDGEDAWAADDAWIRYRDAGMPAERITISSDGGGCLPTFDAEGRVERMDVGQPAALVHTLRALVDRGVSLQEALPAFTTNVARALRLSGKGIVETGADADLVVLEADNSIHSVMARGQWHVRDGRQLVAGTFENTETKAVQ